MSRTPLRTLLVVLGPAVLAPAALVMAGCGGRVAAVSGQSARSLATLAIHADAVRIDTNGHARYSATLADGKAARVKWSVSGGDARAGAGSISADGVYTPPNYLTEDAVQVVVSAAVDGKKGSPEQGIGQGTGQGSRLIADSVELTVIPGFLQPLTPGNLSLGAGGTATVSSSITEVGGGGGVRFTLASDTLGTPGGAGSLSTPRCVRGAVTGPDPAYTVCSVTYTAPANIPVSGSVFIVGTAVGQGTGAGAASPRLSWTRVLLSSAGVSSNPVEHQAHLAWPVMLGSSSGNNADYDSSQGQLSDCCGGTLGALLQDTSGNQYVLSNNHVLARSDQSFSGETIIQPGLIDNGCRPYGYGPGTTAVATLTGYPALNSAATNVDAAIGRVTPGAVDAKGSILELGAKQADGSLAAAPPGISSTGGRGEAVQLGMTVAKSGRTTGLTCAAVSAVNVDVVVDYFTDCAETAHAFTKTFTNQIAMSGTSFSDAGDSGALVVDTANAEPVGLFFAGGTDVNGVEQAIASPVAEVLSALDGQVRGTNGTTNYSFVGGADHPVACLNYGGAKALDSMAGTAALNPVEMQRVEALMPQAQALVNPATGVLRIGLVASKDHPGEGAVALYTDSSAGAGQIPAWIGGAAGVGTAVLPAESAATASGSGQMQVRAASMNQVLAVKQRNAALLMKSNSAIFGVGVGQSLDSPADAAVVLFVDRKKLAGKLPGSVEGQRVRVVLMDRLHVTRAHGTPAQRNGSCRFRPEAAASSEDGAWRFEDRVKLPD